MVWIVDVDVDVDVDVPEICGCGLDLTIYPIQSNPYGALIDR